jgi:hypothetical protein
MIILHDPGLKLHELMALPSETEWVEFKEAKNDFDLTILADTFQP